MDPISLLIVAGAGSWLAARGWRAGNKAADRAEERRAENERRSREEYEAFLARADQRRRT